jgi:NAD-dependent SIR2 family protein deacetylase
MTNSTECFSCGKTISEKDPHEVITETRKFVPVCRYCYAHVVRGAEEGYMPPRADRLFAKTSWRDDYVSDY